MAQSAQTDFSSFMCVILMLIGVLMLVLITNVLAIISNPENVKITSIITSSIYTKEKGEQEGMSPFPYGNKSKEPLYVDVYRDHLVLYPGEYVISLRDLEQENNRFEKLISVAETNRETEYIVLLARPRSASVVRRLKKVIHDRGIDVGIELFEADRDVNYDKAIKASGRKNAAQAEKEE